MPPTAKIKGELSIDGKKALAQSKGVAKKMSGAMSKVAAVGGGLLGAGAAYKLAGEVKQVAALDGALTRLAIQAHMGAEAEKELHKQILNTSVATGKGRDSLQEYLQGVIDSTGNIDIAVDSLQAAAKASQVTGADMNGLGLIVSDMATKFNMTGKQAGDALAIMIEQGEKGKWTLNEMARTGTMAMSVAGLAGMEGAEGLREMGATMQLIRQGFATAEEAATGFKTMVTRIYSPAVAGKLKAMGISLETPSGDLRKFGDIFLDILDKAKGDTRVLADVFGSRGILGVATFNKILEKSGGDIDSVREALNDFRNVTGSAKDMNTKFTRAMAGAEGQGQLLKAQFHKLLEETILTEGSMSALKVALEGLGTSTSYMGENIKFLSDELVGWMRKKGIIEGEDKRTDEEMADASLAAKSQGFEKTNLARRRMAAMAVAPNNMEEAVVTPDMEYALNYFMKERGISDKGKAYKKLHAELQDPSKYENLVQAYGLHKQKGLLETQRKIAEAGGVDPSSIFEGAKPTETKLDKETIRALVDGFEAASKKGTVDVFLKTTKPLAQGGAGGTTKAQATE